jgi:class 3 adenylate cyclase
MAEDRRVRVSITDDKSSRPSIEHGSNSQSPINNLPEITAQAEWKVKMFKVIDHWSYTTLMTVLTIYALFGDDVRVSAFDKDADVSFWSITVVCLFFFTLEIILGSLCKQDYWLGFFFWLDLVSTISLITDIGWVWNQVTSGSEAGDNATKATQIARAGRASRAGTRAARIIRIIRVIRLIRIVKLYKMAKDSKKQGEAGLLVRGSTNFRAGAVKKAPVTVVPDRAFVNEESAGVSLSADFSGSQIDEEVQDEPVRNPSASHAEASVEAGDGEVKEIEEEKDEKVHEQSKVGKQLSELTTRRVIMLVLGVLFGVPFFLNTLYTDNNTSYEYGLEVMDKMIGNNTNFRRSWDSYIEEHKNLKTPLIYLEVLKMGLWETDTDVNDLRDSERQYVVLNGKSSDYDYYSVAIFDLRYSTRLEAQLSICKTIFICIILAVSSSVLTQDAQVLVLTPIENMIEKVKKISENPLEAAQEQERREVAEETARQKKEIITTKGKKKKEKVEEEPMETVILETTLNKIGALLALGFGEAGSEIIATNMQKGGGEVDPMIPGKKTHCIFGFCDIRDFADATEVLQQEVLMFVNEVAYIVHKTVDYFSGSANKNIGDAFLLVWKFPESVLQVTEDGKGFTLSKDNYVCQLADMSVISFLKIIAEIHKNPKILKYRDHEALTQRIPGFSVKMGFGLHQGWAIEGAIGSEFKIDASYLSPNVNMASRLEAATKQFGVHILISSVLYNICSKVTQGNMRRVDKVTVKGSKQPIELYTCEIYPSALKPAPEPDKKIDMKKTRVLGRIARKKLNERALKGEYNIYELWDEDDDLINMRRGVSKAFIKEFEIALQDYLDGKWTEAKAGFKRAMDLKGAPDGPCQVLIDFINSEGGVAPSNWPGYRELHDK